MNKELEKIMSKAHRAVFFGGAGVSTESNIPDFRSETGLYSRKYPYPPEEILSHSFFVARPELFYEFYRDKMLYPDAKPNAAHIALAKLEREGKIAAVVTQNIDSLHQAAGSKRVYELHGSVMRNRCMKCGKSFPLEYILSTEGVPHCDECSGIIKPDVVLYEEALDDAVVTGAVRAITNADVLIVGGTSLTVYPAAGLINYFSGDSLVLINKTPTPADGAASLVIRDPIGKALGDC